MTELLKEAIQRLRQLPEPQDHIARAVIFQLEEEEPERDDAYHAMG